MKKHILFLIFASLLVYSCKSNSGEDVSLEPLQNVKCTPFVASVIFSWDKPTNSDYYYTQVSYNTLDGQMQQKKISKYSVDPNNSNRVYGIVGGFTDTNEYDFKLQSYGYSGAISEPVSVKGTPKDREEAKDYVMSTISVTPQVEGATVSWNNETKVGVELVVNYVDKGDTIVETRLDATETKTATISNLAVEKPIDIKIYAINKGEEAKSAEKVLNITPLSTEEDAMIAGMEYILSSYYGINQMKLTYNTTDKNEFTVVTTGGDPYAYTKLLQQPRGKTLVMRYKCSKAMSFQIFWMPKGAAPGPYTTTVTIPAANEWTTFRYDYSAAIDKASWGSANDHLRIDFGSSSNVTMQVRNMHFE